MTNSSSSDSKGAINVVIDVVAKNLPPQPIDSSDPDYPRLLDLKRRLDAAKKAKKRRSEGGDSRLRGK